MSRSTDPGRREPDRPGLDEIAALHEEIERLPERYRTAIVLCDLEGLTHQEAGRRLGRPSGTISARVSRARERLRDRLRRRGLEPTPAPLIARIARDAVVPPALRTATVAAGLGMPAAGAADLARGVLRELFAARLKAAFGATAAMAMLAAGIGLTGSGPGPGPPTVAGRARTGPDDRGAASLPKFARCGWATSGFPTASGSVAPSTRPTAGPWSRSTSRAGSASGTPPKAGPLGRSATRPSGSARSRFRRMGRPWRPTTISPACSSGTWRPAASSGDGTSPGRAPTIGRCFRPTAGPSPSSSPAGGPATRGGGPRPSSSWLT